jgi:death-on-curing protein
MTGEPKWLTLDMVLAIHDEQLAQFDGGEGMRDLGLLESALARPANRYHYEAEAKIIELAAALGAEIVGNHPFVDGNKRTGVLSIQAFLVLNGWLFSPSQAEEVRTILALDAGEISEPDLARWIEANAERTQTASPLDAAPPSP